MTFKSGIQPFCRYCGKRIPKRTDYHSISQPGMPASMASSIAGPLYSKAECQARVNSQVVSVRYHQPRDWDGNPTGERQIISFTTWDGQSYEDEFFCNGSCAHRFAYLMARGGHCTASYNEAAREAARAVG